MAKKKRAKKKPAKKKRAKKPAKKRAKKKPAREQISPGTLPPKAARMLDDVYERERGKGRSKKRAAEIAWGVVKKSYYKRGTRWRKRKRRLKVGEAAPRESNPKTRKLKRGPINVDRLETVSEHGRVLDLVVDHGNEQRKYTFTGRDKPLLLWSPKYKALLWWEGSKMPPRRKVDKLTGRAANAWSRFHRDEEPDTVRVVNRTNPKTWERLGRGVTIGYRNPAKWGKRDADHELGRQVKVYRAGRLWVLRGGKLRITRHGIEG